MILLVYYLIFIIVFIYFYQNNKVNLIDMSGFEAGVYHLIVTYENLQFTKKIVKQLKNF